MKSAAVFLDRDGTIIRDHGYVSEPGEVELLPGTAQAIRRFSDAGYLVVLASNQSGIARGLFKEDDLERVHGRLEELLAAEGVALDGAYYCPYLDGPDATVKAYRRDSELRKPKPGMLLQAARELNVDLKRSWMIGDSHGDVEAGSRAGCRTVLIANGHPAAADEEQGEENAEGEQVKATLVARNLLAAADAILGALPKSARESSAAVSAGNEQVLTALEKIQETLDRAQRPRRQEDFSLIRLGAALLQMFAIMTALWGAVALFEDAFPAASARFALAGFLQLASVSAFAIDRFR